ncbi:MAG: hypothetical protein H7647_07690 [Candidatus Heimdallarchaeota archaeon]|nr:hypothetical protein [Candidatus Heimdallarchaeota archaeon]MCK4254307.1 hypothetical protein [Candidatus Heimdallarchaeota archaeon]
MDLNKGIHPSILSATDLPVVLILVNTALIASLGVADAIDKALNMEQRKLTDKVITPP